MTTDIRSILNLFEALEEFEYPVPELPVFEEHQCDVYVQYTRQGIILKGEGVTGDYFFTDSEGGEEYGAFNFKANLNSGKIDIDPEDYSGERDVYPIDERMEEAAKEIIEAFKNEYGDNWANIYKRLHKGGRASAQEPNYQDELKAKQAEFKKQAVRLYTIAPKIFHSVLVRMKRAGATKEQLNYVREIESSLNESKWNSILRQAINSNGHTDEAWFAKKNYTTADLTELIDLIIKYMTELLMSNLAWRINSIYPGF